MKCVIPGINIKVFGRAIHSLSKIGEELYIEPLEHGLALRTVNSSRSAYACFVFAPNFFQHYDDGADEVNSQDSDDILRCKIAMKSCLTVFKSLSTVEKMVERCKVHLDMGEARLVFQLYCRHGIVKTHNLTFIECETLQAVFSKDMCPNSLTASPKLLCDAVLNFQMNQEEITLIVSPEKILLKNYVEDEPDQSKVMHTELCLEPEEFDNCQVGIDTGITFCLKELRAILAFAEVTTLPVSMHFETSGRPVVLTIDSDSTFEANFVLATLADNPTQTSTASQSRTATTQSRMAAMQSRTAAIQSKIAGTQSGTAVTHKRCQSDLLADEWEDEEEVKQVTGGGGSTIPGPSKQTESIETRHGVDSPVIPVQGIEQPTIGTCRAVMSDEDSDGDDAIPGTPPAKRFRSLFFGSSQASSRCTQNSQNLPRVLAEDTDEDD